MDKTEDKIEDRFETIQNAMALHYDMMCKKSAFLYTLNLEKNELWDIYLASFPEGTNDIFRERAEHDCSCCRNFINNFGDTVAIIDNKMVSLWDFELEDDTYSPVAKALSNHIKDKIIKDVFVSKFKKIGTAVNHEQCDNGEIITWTHFNVELPQKFVMKADSESIATHKGDIRAIKDVFQRSLVELTQDSVLTVLELISQNSLYKGDEWKKALTDFSKYQKEFVKCKVKERNTYVWEKATSVGKFIGKIRNHAVGTLLINISEGMELDVAVKKYESIVAPTNYKRPKPIYTKAMLEKAKKKIEELGYMDSLQRRNAIIGDISINNVLFSNKDSVKKMQDIDVFDEMSKEVPINPKSFNRVEEIDINTFITDVLPTIKEMEVLLESNHAKNMVSLIAPIKADSKTMFKWNNNYCWVYTGNITDSDMKRNVKSAGGKVDGDLRFSIQWNENNEYNKDDYDAHCKEPNGHLIYYSDMFSRKTGGQLDVDITNPKKDVPAVENITWADKNKMDKGVYAFCVHDYANRGGNDGFRAEIEFSGQVYKFDYPKGLRQGEKIQVAEVTFDGNNFTIKEKLSSDLSSREIWNLKTNNFVPVSIMMHSPNHWDEQEGIGNKHYLFMLKGCINDENPNGFFNEYLNNELTEHKKVFEALGGKMKVDKVDNQLSGVGFSTTQRNSVIVKIKGQTERIIKVKI